MGMLTWSDWTGANNRRVPVTDLSPTVGGTVGQDHSVPSRRRFYRPVKAALEWLVALHLFILTAPLVLLLAVLVKATSRGPAFYTQMRLGKNSSIYRLYKLRTMVHNAEARTGPVWAARNDCRTTPLGRFLRSTHLDELPQLWNILRGEMGLIGPRPERPEIALRLETRIPHYRQRLLVRPGITGLAQMLVPADDPQDPTLRGSRAKVAHDVFYVREFNALLDLRIAVCTPFHFLAEALEAVRRSLLGQYGAAAQVAAEILPPEDPWPAGPERQAARVPTTNAGEDRVAAAHADWAVRRHAAPANPLRHGQDAPCS